MIDVSEQMVLMQSRDQNAAHQAFLRLHEESATSSAVFGRFDSFVDMLDDPSSYARVRGFLLIVANARWDNEGRVAALFDRLADLLHDPKPTAVRQCVQALPELAESFPNLAGRILNALAAIDPGAYHDSMQSLIAADVAQAMNAVRTSAADIIEDTTNTFSAQSARCNNLFDNDNED